MSSLKPNLRVTLFAVSCTLGIAFVSAVAQNSSKPVKYKSIAINSPKNDATIRLSEGPMSVSVKLSPDLQTDFEHQIRILLDGRQVDQGEQTSFQLTEVYRGTHTVTAQVVDRRGAVLIRTKPIKVNVHQHSILFKSAN